MALDGEPPQADAGWHSPQLAKVLAGFFVLAVVALGVSRLAGSDSLNSVESPTPSADAGGGGTAQAASEPPSTAITAVPTLAGPTPFPYQGWIDPGLAGQPYPGSVNGLLTFRGNPSRTYYGTGPIPESPVELWRFGSGSALCSPTTVGEETSEWCGTGWTGQPAVFDRDGQRWVVFGSFAPAVHFLDAESGGRILPDFVVGDLIKGSVTVDPDGFPLVYFGSRDNFFRVVSFDGAAPRELWTLDAEAVTPTLWNDDWDSTALVLDDFLFVGGENSQWHAVELHRDYDADGAVTVSPEIVFHAPGWDEELLSSVGDSNVSIEASMTISGDLLWFANSGGLVQAWDIGPLRRGTGDPERVFRFWTGDDTDASVVVDADGFAYVGVELERLTGRSLELGQVMKLDRRNPDPVVWSRDIHVSGVVPEGVWATVALDRDVVYVPTDGGFLYALDRETGQTRWRKKLQGPLWSSPVVVDNVLIQADCNGVIHAYDVSDTSVEPPELWSIQLPWCIESTPAVWEGVIYVGHRRGEVWAIGDR